MKVLLRMEQATNQIERLNQNIFKYSERQSRAFTNGSRSVEFNTNMQLSVLFETQALFVLYYEKKCRECEDIITLIDRRREANGSYE
jgi:hypothetical protein